MKDFKDKIILVFGMKKKAFIGWTEMNGFYEAGNFFCIISHLFVPVLIVVWGYIVYISMAIWMVLKGYKTRRGGPFVHPDGRKASGRRNEALYP